MKCAVAVLTVDLLLLDSHSLKARRAILNSLKERLRNKFNVSVAEADDGDSWQRASLILTTGGSSPAFVSETLTQALRLVDSDERAQVTMHNLRFYE